MEGQPILYEIPKTKLQYVVNTDWALFLYDKSTYYLLAGERWLMASSLQGPWAPTMQLPKDMEKMVSDQQFASLKQYIPPPPSSANAVVPTVFYSTVPAVVILFDGQPTYSKIPDTQLVYATNTRSYLFVYSPTNQFYYMTGGRWFTANKMEGPWTFATPSLPTDFSHIPPSSPAAQVLSSVPGTEEAKDAVMIAQVPTRITVNSASAAAQANVTYAGAPQFAPIEGTTLSYATNTAQKVIQVGEFYYLCLTGIWFVSVSPTGPWEVADTVPQVIYTIPPSSPVYNVTYVTQVVQPSGTVQASYTAGYMGAFVVGVAVGAVIAGGTGYYYPPYVYHPAYGYPYCYHYPTTYGSTSYYHSTTGAYGVSQTAYGPYGTATRSASSILTPGLRRTPLRSPLPMGHRKLARPITRTPVRPLLRIKAPTDTAPGEVPKFQRTARAPIRDITRPRREPPVPCRPRTAERPWGPAARTETAHPLERRPTATCTPARTEMFTRIPAAVRRSTAATAAGIP